MPAQFTKHFVQDLQQDIKIRQCGTIVFNKDNESNIISVDLYNGQEEYSGGGSVAGACICPDGSTVPLTGSISGKTASVTLTGDCFAFPGQIGIGIQVVSGTVKTTVLKAIYNVELFETDDMVDPGSRITASVGQLVADIEAATAEIPASDMASLMSGIAPMFSTSTNYAAGAYVYYSGTLYRFTDYHAAGSWTGTDAALAVVGPDVSTIKSIISAETVVVDNLHSLVNYGYDTPYHKEAIENGDNWKKIIGVDRNRQIVTLNLATAKPSTTLVTNTRVKVSGDIEFAANNPGLQAWTSGLTLQTGHMYKVTNTLIGGTCSNGEDSVFVPAIYVYRAAETSRCNTAERSDDKKTYYAYFTAEDNTQYNITIGFDENTAVFDDAKMLVYMEDLTESKLYAVQQSVSALETDVDTLEGSMSDAQQDIETLETKTSELETDVGELETNLTIVNEYVHVNDDKFNEALSYINYGYDTDADLEPSGNTNVEIKRRMTEITLDGSTGGSATRIKINNTVAVATSDAGSKAFTDPITDLISGHTYAVVGKLLSGSAALDDVERIPTISVYKAGEASSKGSAVLSDDGKTLTRTFVADGSSYHIVLYCTAGFSFDHAKISIVMIDETNNFPIKYYYQDEMNDTIQKAIANSTSPALTFLVATDCHRYSSNADGVQNFEDMIANMNYFASKVKCDCVLNLGDVTDGNVEQSVTLERTKDCLQLFHSIGVPYLFTIGNHDTNPYGATGSPYLLTMEQIFSAYYSATKDLSAYNFGSLGTDYYLDYDAMNLRIISLNANNAQNNKLYAFGTTTQAWLETVLNTDKTVLCIMHQTPIETQIYNNTSTTRSAGIISALQSFVNNGGKLVLLSGHTHLDIAFIDPWFSVMLDCQRFSDTEGYVVTPEQEDDTTINPSKITGFIDNIVKNARTAGTVTEDLWSVGILKPDVNELDLIRFGAGADRYFHYAPIAPGTVTSKLESVTWSTSDASVATVSNGVITGVGTGKCAVIAKDSAGNYECWIVNVE